MMRKTAWEKGEGKGVSEDHGYSSLEEGYVRGNSLVLRLPIAGKEGSARKRNQ